MSGQKRSLRAVPQPEETVISVQVSAGRVLDAAGVTDRLLRRLYSQIHYGPGPVYRDDFARRAGVSVRTVGRALATLVAQGLIVQVALNDHEEGISGYGNRHGYEAAP